MPSIEAVNLSKQYGSFTAVSNLNLKAEGAKCVGFLGPNGAGKTTTLKMFTDLITPSSGKALINGVDVHKQKEKALASVGALIETPEIYSSLTAREALKMIAEIRGVPSSEQQSRIEYSISEVKMEDWIDKRVNKFSKGMKQRICIASALLSDPCIILLDEPTSGLDPRGMSEVRDIIKSLKNHQRLIFMSSHILSEVADVCDEVAMVDQGKLIVHDTLANVTAKASNGENIVEVGIRHSITPGIMSKVTSISGVESADEKDENTLLVHFAGGIDVQERVLADIFALKIGLVSFKPASSALEEAYLKLVKGGK
ncbi:MAG: ABC transporter ATP-binding protein [Candidatus Bathyarchaeota archaeon]|nr:ABC transporter ATP-binding protein [Candidatus Bathyarchaeota archaeon]